VGYNLENEMKDDLDLLMTVFVAAIGVSMLALIGGMVNDGMEKNKIMLECIQKYTPEQCVVLEKGK
jgi:hypothetical protein